MTDGPGRAGPAGRRLIVEADGGSRGNPGPAGYGAVVRDADTGEVLAERAEGLGRVTNNVAEYRGLIAGLTAAAGLRPASVEVRMDSKLVVEQMSGRWKVKHPDMVPLAREAMALVRRLPAVRFDWIPRARNSHADRLANEAMDAQAGGRRWVEPAGTAAPAEPDPGPEPAPPPATPGWRPPAGAPTTLLLLRHGQTALSVDRRFSGTGDPVLTATGEAQARGAAVRLLHKASRGLDAAAVVSSPLRRARRTAELAAEALRLPVDVDDRLRETDFGVWEGSTFAEVRAGWPTELAAWLASEQVAPPGGESFAAVGERVLAAHAELVAAHPGRTVLVVSHVTPIKVLGRAALAAGPEALHRLHLDLCSLSTLDFYADGPAVLRGWNDTAHLEALDP